MKKKKKLLISSLLAFLFLSFSISFVSAQIQTNPFSGNDPASYQCIGLNGQIDGSLAPYKDELSGNILCNIDRDNDGKDDKAIIKPPALQQIEIWFVRIIYIIWALVGTYSFILLVFLGYQYMLRGGTTDQELVNLRKRIIYYVIGFALVFLAIPILSTIFRLLNINDDVDCYNVNIPTFQFFFTNLCTAPNLNRDISADEVCQFLLSGDTAGLACSTPGETSNACSTQTSTSGYYFVCSSDRIWELRRF